MNAEQVIDNKISVMLKAGDAMPRAPEDLVERTANRMLAIERGNKAERTLAGSDGSEGVDVTRLAAESVIGRMAQHREMESYLLSGSQLDMVIKDKAFLKAVGNKSPSQILKDVESGKLVRDVSSSLKPREATQNDLNRQVSRIKETKPMSV